MKCPNCGCELRVVWCNAEENDEKYFRYYEGVCSKCRSSYEWYDMYEYTESSSLQRIDPNNHL